MYFPFRNGCSTVFEHLSFEEFKHKYLLPIWLLQIVHESPGIPLPGNSGNKYSCNWKEWKPLKHLGFVGSMAGLGSSCWLPTPQLSYRARHYLYLHSIKSAGSLWKMKIFDMEPEKGILIYSVDVMICGLWHTWGVSELQQIHTQLQEKQHGFY